MSSRLQLLFAWAAEQSPGLLYSVCKGGGDVYPGDATAAQTSSLGNAAYSEPGIQGVQN